MRYGPSLCLAALLASPALADPASDYARMREALPTILFGNDIELQLQLQAEILSRMEGRWVQVTPLMKEGFKFPDANLLARTCDRAGFDVALSGTFGLTLTQRPVKAAPYVIHLTYAGATTYIATVEEAGLVERIAPDKDLAEVTPQVLYNGLVNNGWAGYMSLLPLGEDLVLLQPLARAPELLARCL
jgi:hypothetical protein